MEKNVPPRSTSKGCELTEEETQNVQVQKYIICLHLENTPISGLRVAYYWGLGKLVELSGSFTPSLILQP